MSAGALRIDPEALACLDALYESDPRLAERIDDFLDVLEDDPHAPEVHTRAHALKDGNGQSFSGASVRTATDEAMVLWRTDVAGDRIVVRIIYIGENTLRL